MESYKVLTECDSTGIVYCEINSSREGLHIVHSENDNGMPIKFEAKVVE